jgi:Uma2 family endonuclease
VRPPTTPSVKFTYDDFLHFPDDGKRHEIIDGEHDVTPSPNTKHQVIVGNHHVLLATYLKAHTIGAVFLAPFDVVFSNLDVVEPDLLYISRERRGVLTDKHVRGAPALVAEVLSPGTPKTDETIKRRLYERCDVQEYRVVDPGRDTIRIHRRTGDALICVAELGERNDALRSPLLPGFSAPLTEVFAPPL